MVVNTTSDPPDFEVFRCPKCHVKKSIRSHSLAFRTNLSLGSILLLIHYWSVDANNKIAARELQVTSKTVTHWYNICRRICTDRLERTMIGGLGVVVEIDESLIARRKYHRGRLVPERWVFGGVERRATGEQKRFVEFVSNRTKATLLEVIRRRIAPETTVMSDGWAAYRDLSQYNYRHFVVNHSKNFVNPQIREVHTQNVENQWRQLKRWLRSKGTNIGDVQSYLDEWLYRKQALNVFDDIIASLALLLQ